MPDRVLVDSDAILPGPVFTGPDEEAVAPDDPPDVTAVSRVTGETLEPPIAVAVEDAVGQYTVMLTAADHTAELDIIDLTWSGEAGGKLRTYTQTVEVVGGFYNSIPSLRTVSSLAARPIEQLRKYRTEIEDICEEARGTAYVPRVAIDRFTGGLIRLKHRHVQRILSVTVDGTAQDAARYEVDPVTRTVTTSNGGIWFSSDVAIAYVHGYPSPPAALVEAERIFIRAKCTRDASDSNRNPSSVTNLATQEVYRYTTADPRFGRWTDIDEVNEKINAVPDERVLVR
jgi:hypothetical protein